MYTCVNGGIFTVLEQLNKEEGKMEKSHDMQLPPVILPSGTLGFFGEGYRWHKFIYPFVWLAKKFAMFVAKTVTVDKTVGNMSLKDDSSPKQMRPDCIFIDLKRWICGGMLNAIGLSNFGLQYYLRQGEWQKFTKQWALSIMLVRKTHPERLLEARQIVNLLLEHWNAFNVKPIIKLNGSCPNVKHGNKTSTAEQLEISDVFMPLNAHIIVKLNALADIDSAREIAEHDACSGLCVSNTFPFDEVPDWIKWKVFPEVIRQTEKDKQSKVIKWIKKYSGGGYSGKDMLPIVVAWIASARQAGITKPIVGGGGIFTPLGVWKMYRAGASSVSIGTPLLFRPLVVPFSILTAYVLFKWIPNKWRR